MFAEPIQRFTDNLSTLRDSVALISKFLDDPRADFTAEDIKTIQGMADTVFGNYPNDKNCMITIKVHPDNPNSLHFVGEATGEERIESILENASISGRFLRSISKVKARKAFLYQNSLISLVSFVEWFVSEFLKLHLERYPDAADLSKKTLTYVELKALGTIEDAVKFLLDSKLDDLLREGFEGWLKFLKERLALSMGYLEKDLPYLTEIFQRRNIIVHNGGSANSIYIAKVAAELRKGVTVGTDLVASPEYLEESIKRLELNMVLICAELWKKVQAKDEVRGNLLNTIALEHFKKERWIMGTGLSKFVLNDKGLPEANILVAQLNYWQGLKWQGRYDEIKKEVEQADFRAKDERFQIDLLALADRFEQFYELLPTVYQNGKLKAEDLVSSPIFREIRQQSEYASFREKFQGDFEAAELCLQE